MAFFYDRKETKKKIIITYKHEAVFYFIFIILLVLVLLTSSFINFISHFLKIIINTFVLLACSIIILMKIIGQWNINMEIRKAMLKDKVNISGSRFSRKNPIIVEIEK